MIFDNRLCTLGEGPLWHPEREQMFWFDIVNQKMLSQDRDGQREWRFPEMVSAAGWVDQDVLLIAGERDLFLFDIESEEVETVCLLEQDKPKNRPNDGRADPAGRIWISTLVDARTPATAALYCIESSLAQLKIPDLIVGNGLAFSPQGTSAFLCDTRHKCIWRFDFDCSTGNLSNARTIKHYTEGTARPDGACFADDGSYWVAILEGYRLERFSEQGEFIESISVPLAKPTMPCFGGEQGNILLVTSAQTNDKLPNKPGFENASLIACETRFKGHAEAFANARHLG